MLRPVIELETCQSLCNELSCYSLQKPVIRFDNDLSKVFTIFFREKSLTIVQGNLTTYNHCDGNPFSILMFSLLSLIKWQSKNPIYCTQVELVTLPSESRGLREHTHLLALDGLELSIKAK